MPGASPNVSTDAREDGPKEGKTYRDSVSGLKILFITRRLLHLLDLPISRKDSFLFNPVSSLPHKAAGNGKRGRRAVR